MLFTLLWLTAAQAQSFNCLDCDDLVADLDGLLTESPDTSCVPASGHQGIATLAIQQTPESARYSPELLAFMRAITYTEGAEGPDGYFTEVGGRVYPSGTDVHPGAADVHRYSRTGHDSDAYGKYQMLSSTWAEWAGKAGVPTARGGTNSYGERYYDMSPIHQDQAALGFLQREGLEQVLQSRGVDAALATWQARQWASVPGASQPNDRTGRFRSVYQALLAEERGYRDGGGDCGAAVARPAEAAEPEPEPEPEVADAEPASGEPDLATPAPDPTVPLDVPYAYQYDNAVDAADSATATSVSMMLAHYGAEVSPDHITKSWGAGATQSPAGFADMFNHYAELHGLDERLVARLDGTIADLEAQLERGDPVPVHAYTTPSGGVLVATGHTGSGWTVNDPTGRWNQRFKGAYPRWGDRSGHGVTYGSGPFRRAVATWDGRTPAPIWWHEVVRTGG